MTTFSRGDVVLVPMPFTDLTATKQRPALVVSNDTYNATGSDLVIMAITSGMASPRLHEYRLQDWHSAGLLRPSTVKAVLGTVHQPLVRRRLGQVTERDRLAVDGRLRELVGV